MNEPAPNLLDARPDAPAAIVELYFRMMEKHPDARQQTAQEVADSLAAWLTATATLAGRWAAVRKCHNAPRSGGLPPARSLAARGTPSRRGPLWHRRFP
jgi:hypothetical protein